MHIVEFSLLCLSTSAYAWTNGPILVFHSVSWHLGLHSPFANQIPAIRKSEFRSKRCIIFRQYYISLIHSSSPPSFLRPPSPFSFPSLTFRPSFLPPPSFLTLLSSSYLFLPLQLWVVPCKVHLFPHQWGGYLLPRSWGDLLPWRYGAYSPTCAHRPPRGKHYSLTPPLCFASERGEERDGRE